MTKFITTAAVAALALGLCAEATQAQSRERDRGRDRGGVSVGEVVALIDLGARLFGGRDRDDQEEQAASTDYLLEIDGVRGESSDDRRSGVHVAAGDVNGDGRADSGRSGGRDIDHSDGAETAGLLLPAVQRVREAAAQAQDAEEAGSPDQIQSDQGQAGAIAIPSLIRSRRSSGSY